MACGCGKAISAESKRCLQCAGIARRGRKRIGYIPANRKAGIYSMRHPSGGRHGKPCPDCGGFCVSTADRCKACAGKKWGLDYGGYKSRNLYQREKFAAQ